MTRHHPLQKFIFRIFLAATLCLAAAAFAAGQDKMDSTTKHQVAGMLQNVKGSLKKHYFDPNFGGMDIEARFKKAEEKLKTAEYLNQALAIIAQAVLDLNDSHTQFRPPVRNVIVEYGWRMNVVGDAAFITAVKEKSDAEAKGLKPGDEVLKINGFKPTRRELWKMLYYYQTLSPQLKINLSVKSPGGEPRDVEVASQTTQLKRVVDIRNGFDLMAAEAEADGQRLANKHYFKEMGSTLIWKMPDFGFDPAEVPRLMAKAADKQTLILDLRGNPGGYVVTLEKLAGHFFEKDTKIADLKGRKPMDPQIANTKGAKIFKGKVIVLVDAESGSAAEIFARLMQIEKRGTVLGDVTAGAVMQSRPVDFDAGVTSIISYGVRVTNADVIMTDGKSLERVGVMPDERIIPTGKDLAECEDPVMARALEMATGPRLDARAAGRLFPPEPFVERRANIAIDFPWR